MPVMKTEEFKTREIKLSRWARALSHPARVAILHTLAKKSACICGEIVEVLPLAQATVSQHLKELKNAGLVDGTVEGPSSCYCLNKDAVNRLSVDMNELFDELRSGCTDQTCSTKAKGR